MVISDLWPWWRSSRLVPRRAPLLAHSSLMASWPSRGCWDGRGSSLIWKKYYQLDAQAVQRKIIYTVGKKEYASVAIRKHSTFLSRSNISTLLPPPTSNLYPRTAQYMHAQTRNLCLIALNNIYQFTKRQMMCTCMRARVCKSPCVQIISWRR